MTDGHYNYKMIFININESQKTRLEEFFDEIKFYYYTVQKKVESVWDAKIKHKNSMIWPGTDCVFISDLRECTRFHSIKNALNNLDVRQYTIQKWNDAVSYTTGKALTFSKVEASS